MNERDLELLVTLDETAEDEDFHQTEFQDVGIDNGYPIEFRDGEWTCTVSKLTVTTDDPMRVSCGAMFQPSKQKFDIDVCVVACSKPGQVVEQKVFYDLAGIQKQIGVR